MLLTELDAGLPTFDQPEGGDSLFYDRVAAGEAAPALAYFHSPLYQWFLAGLYGWFGRDLFAVRAVQLGLGAATAVLIYLLTLRLFRRISVAALAGLGAGLLGPALLYEGQLLVDGLIALLAALILHALLDGARRPNPMAFLLVGLLLGIAALARAVVLIWLPLVVIYLVMRATSRRDAVRWVAALAVGATLVIAPVTVRNYLVEGDVVLITSNGGLNLYVGNNPDANGSYNLPEGLWFRPGDPLDDFAGRSAATQDLGRVPSSSELSRWWSGKAWSFMAENPGRTLALGKEKLRILINDYEYPQLYNYEVYAEVAPVLSRLPTAGFVVGPGLIGLVAMWLGRHGRRRRLVAALAAAYGLAFLPFFVTGRYRAAWLALLCPFAAWVVVTTVRAVVRRDFRRAVFLGVATAAAIALSYVPLRATPTRANQHLDFARALLRADDAAGAVYWAKRATEVEPRYGEAWALYGRTLRLADRPAEAVELLSDRIDGLSRASSAQRELGAAYLAMSRPLPAAESLQRAISLAPSDTEAWLMLGQSLEELRCFRRAADAYRAVATFGESTKSGPPARRRLEELESRLAGDGGNPPLVEDECELADEARP
jgi:hypothetical protein